MSTKPEKAAEPKFVINPSAPSTGTEGWGYKKDEASSVNFGVPTEERATAETDHTTSDRVVGHVPASPSDAHPHLVTTHPSSSTETATHGNESREELSGDEHVRVRAYELFLERGEEHGHDREDWERAEAEVRGSKAKIA